MRSARGHWLGVLVVLLCVAGIGALQPRLAQSLRNKNVRRDDIFVLPPPMQLRAMTLGYTTAAADLLWAKLIVEHGLHWEEKRAFPDMPNYIDGILALDPQHPLLYDFVDTLLLFTPTGGTEADARLARSYFERGTRERPHDASMWLRYGQFMAFLAPSFIKDPAETERWRKDGAFAIAHAVELGADPDRALAATTILSKAGEKKAAILHLQRSYALTDDPETRRQIMLKLKKLEAAVESEATMNIVEHEWRSRFPGLSRSATLLLGPHRDPAACAGPEASALKQCPEDWTAATRETR